MTYLWHYVISRLAGLFRHHLATSSNGNGVGSTSIDEGRQSPLPKTSTPQLQQPATSTTSDSSAALDYRCFPNQPKIEPQSEVIIFSLSHYYPLASGWSLISVLPSLWIGAWQPRGCDFSLLLTAPYPAWLWSQRDESWAWLWNYE